MHATRLIDISTCVSTRVHTRKSCQGLARWSTDPRMTEAHVFQYCRIGLANITGLDSRWLAGAAQLVVGIQVRLQQLQVSSAQP